MVFAELPGGTPCSSTRRVTALGRAGQIATLFDDLRSTDPTSRNRDSVLTASSSKIGSSASMFCDTATWSAFRLAARLTSGAAPATVISC
jgi:hypothetical protein